MLTIHVRQDNSGHFATIAEAVQSVPYEVPAIILIGPGIYHEKIFCEKSNITLCGAGKDKTILCYADGAFHTHADGRPVGTFRSYTLFLGGGLVQVQNLSIRNDAGDGAVAGQAVAAYVDARAAIFENVGLYARQDTLFIAPLPHKERQINGFLGPRCFTARTPSAQWYNNCTIQGDIDFIFGGGDAVFTHCEIISLNRNQLENGFVTAPSGEKDGLGFVFRHCSFTSNCPPQSVYLGRPWREYGKTRLLACEIGPHIKPEGWHNWLPENEATATFAEHGCTGEGANLRQRVPWAKVLSPQQAEKLNAQVNQFTAQLQAEAKSKMC